MSTINNSHQSVVDPASPHQGDNNGQLEDTETSTETTKLLKSSNKSVKQDVEDKSHFRGISKARFWLLFMSILSGNTIAFFDSTLTASSHPVITSYFHSSNAASWLSTVFYLTSTISQPLYARVSDTSGRRSVALFATTTFFAATAWCAVAQNIGSFIAARAVCGIGAGGVMVMASIITGDLVKIEYRGIYQSYYNIAYGLGNSMGAAFGGLLCDHLGWRAAFGIQLPFIFAFGALAYTFTPKNLGPNLAKVHGKTVIQAISEIDISGAVALSISLTGFILGINLGGNIIPWTHPIVLTSLILSAISTVVLVIVEKRAPLPMLPLRLLSTVPQGNLVWSNFLGMLVINTVLFNVPLFLQAVRQESPTVSGLYLISPLVGVTATAVFSGFFISVTQRIKPMIATGFLCFLAGSISLTFLDPTTPRWLIILLISGTSLGQGFFAPATLVALLNLNSKQDQAVVITTLALMRNLGSTMGVAVSSWILQNALLVYLNRYVTDENDKEKMKIIHRVRTSIKSIAQLDPKHRSEVIQAYSKSLRWTFTSTVIISLIIVCFILPTHIPNLISQADKDENENENENAAIIAAASLTDGGVEGNGENFVEGLISANISRDEEQNIEGREDEEDIESISTTPQELIRRYQGHHHNDPRLRKPSFHASL